MRAALYARFSTDKQNPRSVADQVHLCTQLAERMGAEVVEVFSDSAVSGATMAARPGILRLMRAAGGGAFDVVIAEDLDRLSRDGGHPWDIYYDLRDVGVAIHTVSDGLVTPIHVGLKGTMNAVELDKYRAKARRGMAGVVRSGRHPTQPAYGYRLRREFDAAGKPVRGLLEVDADRAERVRRIFSDYAAGVSPEAIAAALNAEGVPSPKGGRWTAQTIRGSRTTATGLINNRLYVGELVWGRRTHLKDRRTGRRKARKAAEGVATTAPRPELRIVSDDLWTAAQARQAACARAVRPERARRPRRLLSGLVRCRCGEVMLLTGNGRGQAYYACRARPPAGHADRRTPRADQLEARVLEAVRADFLHPEVIEAAVRAYRDAKRANASADGRARRAMAAELAEARRRMARLVAQVEEGMPWAAVAARHQELEARAGALDAELAALEPAVIPAYADAPQKWRRLVEDLVAALDGAPDDASTVRAREAIRQLVVAVHVSPEAAVGTYRLEIEGRLDPILTGADRWLNGKQPSPLLPLTPPRLHNGNEACPSMLLTTPAPEARFPIRIPA